MTLVARFLGSPHARPAGGGGGAGRAPHRAARHRHRGRRAAGGRLRTARGPSHRAAGAEGAGGKHARSERRPDRRGRRSPARPARAGAGSAGRHRERRGADHRGGSAPGGAAAHRAAPAAIAAIGAPAGGADRGPDRSRGGGHAAGRRPPSRCSISPAAAGPTTTSSRCAARCRSSGGAGRVPRSAGRRSSPRPILRWSDDARVALDPAAGLVGLGSAGSPRRSSPARSTWARAPIGPIGRFRAASLPSPRPCAISAGRWSWPAPGSIPTRPPGAGISRAAPPPPCARRPSAPSTSRRPGQAEWTSHYRARGATIFTGGVRAYVTPGAGTRVWIGRYLRPGLRVGSPPPDGAQ